MVNNSTNINKANTHLSPQIIEHINERHNTLQSHVLAWDTHKNVAEITDKWHPNPSRQLDLQWQNRKDLCLNLPRFVSTNKRPHIITKMNNHMDSTCTIAGSIDVCR